MAFICTQCGKPNEPGQLHACHSGMGLVTSHVEHIRLEFVEHKHHTDYYRCLDCGETIQQAADHAGG